MDGSLGEGGGQILRTSLSLCAALRRPVCVINIRAGRPQPGLSAQHVASARAAAAACGGALTGDAIGSTSVTLRPGAAASPPQRLRLRLDIGSAGSTLLVLATLLPALLRGGAGADVELLGGSHAAMAPSFDFFAICLAPLLARIGCDVAVSLLRHGFYPAGGGVLTARIEPLIEARPLVLLERGAARGVRAEAIFAGRVPPRVAEAEAAIVASELGWRGTVAVRRVEAAGDGNALTLVADFEHAAHAAVALGERGVPAVAVARRACAAMAGYLAVRAPVGEHLADQLLLPLVLGAGGVFRATAASAHLVTNCAVINEILGFEAVRIDREAEADGAGVLVTVAPCGAGGAQVAE